MKKILKIIILIIFLSGCGKKEYTVTFDTSGGTLLKSINLSAGDTIEDIEEPTKEGYIFVTWEKDGLVYDKNTPVTSDITLTATWTEEPNLEKEYKVIFNVNGNKEEIIVKSKEEVPRPRDPSIKYTKFLGWYDSNNLYNFDTPVTKDLYLVAKFEKEVVKVEFNLNGGSGIKERQIDAGKKLEKPEEPTKIGYKFLGWYLNNKEYNFDTPVTKNITLEAKWEAKKYVTINFDTQGGKQIKGQVIEINNTVTKPNDPEKAGYIFKYWALNGLQFDFNTKINSNITLIAIYEENKQNIS